MERRDEDNLICIEPQIPHDWARLIRKLRWIGRESRAPGIGGEHFTPSREVRRIFRTLQHRLEADARDDTRRIPLGNTSRTRREKRGGSAAGHAGDVQH